MLGVKKENGHEVFYMIGKVTCKKDLKMWSKGGDCIIVPAGTVIERFSRNEKSHIFVYDYKDVMYEHKSGLKYIQHVGLV